MGLGNKFALRWSSAGLGVVLALLTGAAEAATLRVQVTAEGRPLEDAVVSAQATGAAASSAKSGTKSSMVQQEQQFKTFVLPVQVGTTVEFPNRDPFRHHVYSFSPAKTFELKLYGGGETKSVTFDKEGVVALGCNIHDNMLAYVYVVGTPYFAKTEGGVSTIDLPAGSYRVKVWHPSQRGAGAPARDVTVTAAGPMELNMSVDLKRDRQQRPRGAMDENAY